MPRAPAGGPGQPGSGAPPGARGGNGDDEGEGTPAGRPARRSAAGQRAEPSPEELAEAQAEMEAVRQQLLEAPIELVISNHVMGLWELAALNLSERPPRLPQAQLAIDAMAALLEGLRGRLGEPEKSLTDALAEIRMAFVERARAQRSGSGTSGPGEP